MSVTMSDIAARAGTSVAAVSVTLNGAKSKTLRISDSTRERIEQAARELGYRRNPVAGALATGRSKVIGLMLPYMRHFADQDPFFSTVAMGVTAGASSLGYNVMLYSAAGEYEGARAAAMIDRRIDGLILVSPPESTPIFDECRKLKMPVVTLMGDHLWTDLTVDSDDLAGGRVATRHLVALGHRRIAHLAGRDSVVTAAPRLKGYRVELEANGIEFVPELLRPGEFDRATSYGSTMQLMKLPAEKRPTAIFAANDLSAHGAIEAIQDAGYRVPEDVAVVGYDDTWYATVPKPALTSVHVDVGRLGARAAELLVGALADGDLRPSRIVQPVYLFIRESCGASSFRNHR
jgi:LacI family transcriptional regulator